MNKNMYIFSSGEGWSPILLHACQGYSSLSSFTYNFNATFRLIQNSVKLLKTYLELVSTLFLDLKPAKNRSDLFRPLPNLLKTWRFFKTIINLFTINWDFSIQDSFQTFKDIFQAFQDSFRLF